MRARALAAGRVGRGVLTAARALVVLALAAGAACRVGNGEEAAPSLRADRAGKRAAPAEVPALTRAGTRYEVVHWGKARGLPQNGGYLAAIDEASGQERWLVRVYETRYDPSLEADKQDVFLTALELGCGGECVEVEDERGRRYRVDLASRAVIPR